MLTLLNIGNSNTQIAEADASGRISGLRTMPTIELAPEFFGSGEFAAASVVREARSRIPADTFFVNCGNSGLDFTMVDSSTVGADRIANAIEAASRGRLPVAVIDCGTAITFEVVDAEKRFRGGAILPGRRMMRQALHDYTSLLPVLPWSETLPRSCGVDTNQALALGIDRGAVGAVREIMTLLLDEFPGMTFVAAGGDRDFFIRALPQLADGGNDFTLRGVLKAYLASRRT